MNKSDKILSAISKKAPETLISVDEICNETEINYFWCESLMRAIAKDGIIQLASICEVGGVAKRGIFLGTLKEKEYWFIYKKDSDKFKKQIKNI